MDFGNIDEATRHTIKFQADQTLAGMVNQAVIKKVLTAFEANTLDFSALTPHYMVNATAPPTGMSAWAAVAIQNVIRAIFVLASAAMNPKRNSPSGSNDPDLKDVAEYMGRAIEIFLDNCGFDPLSRQPNLQQLFDGAILQWIYLQAHVTVDISQGTYGVAPVSTTVPEDVPDQRNHVWMRAATLQSFDINREPVVRYDDVLRMYVQMATMLIKFFYGGIEPSQWQNMWITKRDSAAAKIATAEFAVAVTTYGRAKTSTNPPAWFGDALNYIRDNRLGVLPTVRAIEESANRLLRSHNQRW